MTVDNLPVFKNFPAEKEQNKLVKWLKNDIYAPISNKVNWLLAFFTPTDDGEGGEYAPGFGPVSYIDFDIEYMDGQKEGRLQWNNDEGTLEVGMPGGSVNLQIGQEMLVRVTNDTGIQIDNGTPVYISDATGTNIKVTPADADFAGGVGLRTFAVATEDIAGNQKGFVTTQGFVRDIDTTFAPAAGMPAYLAVGGGFTTTPPDAPDISYLLGVVTIANHATAGEIYIIQTSIPNLSSLSDVDVTGLVDATPLQWDSGEDVWATLSTWRDELNQLIGSRLESPSSNITQNNAESSVTYDTNTDLTDYVTMNVQLNHDWEIGTDVHPHIHWWQEQAAIPNWMIEYRWQINGEIKTTTWTPMIWQASAFLYASGTLNQITGFAPISPPVGAGLSDIMQIRLIRDNNNDSALFAGVDPVGVDVDAVNLDVHIEVNSLGSKTEFTK